jgi:hypothetical protein
VPLAGHGLRPIPLRRRASRPQLKRDPLGSHEFMRTFPRALATFQQLVNERGEHLRGLSFAELERLARPPMGPIGENLTVDSRQATIATVVERWHDGTIRVVLHGSMKPRFLPVGHHVAMDGFYKHLDGSVTPMSDKEFNDF